MPTVTQRLLSALGVAGAAGMGGLSLSLWHLIVIPSTFLFDLKDKWVGPGFSAAGLGPVPLSAWVLGGCGAAEGAGVITLHPGHWSR